MWAIKLNEARLQGTGGRLRGNYLNISARDGPAAVWRENRKATLCLSPVTCYLQP